MGICCCLVVYAISTNTAPDYGYATTTSYGAQGGAGGGGFIAGGSQTDSPASKRSLGKDTLRPVTIKQLNEAHHPHPDAEYFMIDGAETTQVTFVGQIRNISTQTTNVTYRLDDGTGTIEGKLWLDAEALNNPSNDKLKLTEQAYARVWGRLKQFNSKRHVGVNIIRPIQDFNEIQYHLLEATVVHLHFTKGPLESQQANGGATDAASGGQQNGYSDGGTGRNRPLPPGLSQAAKRVWSIMVNTEQTNEGLHKLDVASRAGLDVGLVEQAGQELQNYGFIYTTFDDDTWAVLEV